MAATTATTDMPRPTRWGRMATVACAWLFTAGAIIQVFLVGLSLFQSAAFWPDHRSFGMMIGPLALLLPILALAGRVGRRIGIMAVVVMGLYILQIALANLDNGYLAAFHALNAFALIGISGQVGAQTLGLLQNENGVPSSDGGASGAYDIHERGRP